MMVQGKPPSGPGTATSATTDAARAFCSGCGARLDANARFCHQCGTPVGGAVAGGSAGGRGMPGMLMWGVPALALVVVLILVATQYRSVGSAPGGATTPLSGIVPAPDISSMTPQERADRLFNRVMRLSSEGHADSAAFFAPMALGAFEALAPLTPHHRYDMGLVALVAGNVPRAAAQADSILAQRPTHLLGLSLAARAAEARGDATAAAAFRRRLVAAEPAERAANLPEYTDHDADIRTAVSAGRGG